MPRRKLSTEERHAIQKKKLENSGSGTVIEKGSYTPAPNQKLQVVEAAARKGYKCELDLNSVVIFYYDNNEEEITKWLRDNYSRKELITRNGEQREVSAIPFSYGFSKAQ